jgi:hypothetical protein
MIKYLVGILSACFLVVAHAAPIAKVEFDGAVLTLHNTKCQLIPEGFHAVFTHKSVTMKACWVADENFVYVIYEDKDLGQIPKKEFKPIVNV